MKRQVLIKYLPIVLGLGLLTGCAPHVPVPEIQESTEYAAEETKEPQASRELKAGERRLSPAEEIAERELAEHAGEIKQDGNTEKTPVKVKGIYVSAHVAGNKAMMDQIIAQIDKTELNAVVIDFKTDEGHIAAEIDSPLFRETDACRNYISDLPALMEQLKAHNIYTIARVVAFKDPHLAEKKPDWCLKKADGSVYRDKKGLAWVNPYRQEVWDYLVETGLEAGKAGFDEIQFDYIRFATDSTMKQVAVPEEETKGRSKTQIVTEFSEYAANRLGEQGLFVSADVFGAIIGSKADADAVGQIYGEMAEHLDYICPMIYPSHYGDGNFGLDHPDLHPYEVVFGALTKSKEDLSRYDSTNGQAIVRPWLQDFTASYLKHYIPYREEELRLQIQAVYDSGYEEWILWNAANKYHYGGLLDEPETQTGGEVPAL